MRRIRRTDLVYLVKMWRKTIRQDLAELVQGHLRTRPKGHQGVTAGLDDTESPGNSSIEETNEDTLGKTSEVVQGDELDSGCRGPIETNEEDMSNYKLGIVTALDIENKAVINMAEETSILKGTDHTYKVGKIHNTNVVFAQLPPSSYGEQTAAVTVTDLYNEFRSLKLVFMVGICGGVPNPNYDEAMEPGKYQRPNVCLGDAIVSFPIQNGGPAFIQFDYGKITDRDTLKNIGLNLKRKKTITLSSPALEAGRFVRDEFDEGGKVPLQPIIDTMLPNLEDDERFSRPEEESDPNHVHFGILASSNSVIRNAEVRDAIAKDSKVIGFEMENGGVADAADLKDKYCMFVRGVCDLSDEQKNKVWQGFAALAAAAVTKAIIQYLPKKYAE